MVSRPPSTEHDLPTFVIPFALERKQAVAAVKKFLGRRRFFAPAAIRRASIESVQGIYLPTYLYSAQADAHYSAQIGQRYQTRDMKGRSQTRTEWYRLDGHYSAHLADIVVSASTHLANDALEAVEPFDFDGLRAYDPGFWQALPPKTRPWQKPSANCLPKKKAKASSTADCAP